MIVASREVKRNVFFGVNRTVLWKGIMMMIRRKMYCSRLLVLPSTVMDVNTGITKLRK